MKRSICWASCLAFLLPLFCVASPKKQTWGESPARWGMEMELTEWSLPYLMPWFDFNDFQVRTLMKFEKDLSKFPKIPEALFDQYFTYNPELIFQMLDQLQLLILVRIPLS